MLRYARNIWETKIQCVCSVISARDGDDVELFLCANFAQASFDPPRVIVNPNVLYPIERAIRRERQFAINVFQASWREAALRMVRVRRRTPGKRDVLGLPIAEHERLRIPYIPGSQRIVFCELEQTLDTGDHTVMIARVLDSIDDPAQKGKTALLYPEISGAPSRYPRVSKAVRTFMTFTGTKELVKRALGRGGVVSKPDISAETYELGGQTAREIDQILNYGVIDRGRAIKPPARAPAVLRRKVGVCVVGVGQWGSFHAQLFRRADPNVVLFVCGRDPDRLARVARSVGASDCIIGLERALEDPRVEALSLVLPHHLHAHAVHQAVDSGKHVMVEKPIANTLADADSMIEAARRKGVVLMVAEDMHFRPAVRESVHAIARGNIGEPLYFKAHAGGKLRPRGWKANSGMMGGGVWMDLGVHYIRALRIIMGEPDRVFATRAMQIDTKMSGEDSAQVIFSSSQGWQAHLLLNWAGPRGNTPDILVSGDRGVLQLWPSARFLDWIPDEPLPLVRFIGEIRPRWLGEKLMKPQYQRVRIPITDRDTQGYLTEVREFLASVAEGRAPTSDPIDARRDLEIVLCGYEALRQESWVDIPPYQTALSRG